MEVARTLGIEAALVRTLDPGRPRAACVGVKGGVIAAVGSKDEVKAALGPGHAWLDLRPATVVPGFTDSHIHLIEWALGLGRPDLSGATGMEDALQVVAQLAREAPAEAWLELKNWKPEWRREAELADLDEASRGRPVALVAHDLHSAWLNSEVLRRLEVTAERPDPEGGTIERDATGAPTGVLKERALDWWYQGRPRRGFEERTEALRTGQRELNRMGVTGVHSVEAPDSFRVVQGLAESGELSLRVLHHMPHRFLGSLIECGIRSGFGGDYLQIGGIKMFTDGALGSKTAWMLDSYEGSDDRGIRRLELEEFKHDVSRAARAGLASTVHAIGDAAVRMTLDALEGAPATDLAMPHRIEHLQCVSPADLGRAAGAGITASMQPSHLLTDMSLIEPAWGSARAKGTFALRSLIDAGTLLAFGSDAPVEAADPREGFYAAVGRRDRSGKPDGGWYPEEAVTAEEVLYGYTVAPARAAGCAGRRGRIATGYDADLAAWDIDLAASPAEEMLAARAVATIVGGCVEHEE